MIIFLPLLINRQILSGASIRLNIKPHSLTITPIPGLHYLPIFIIIIFLTSPLITLTLIILSLITSISFTKLIAFLSFDRVFILVTIVGNNFSKLICDYAGLICDIGVALLVEG